jgi:hypothetical protein
MDQCTRKNIGECGFQRNVLVNIMQVEAKKEVQTKKQKYPRALDQRRFSNQSYNQPLGGNDWLNNRSQGWPNGGGHANSYNHQGYNKNQGFHSNNSIKCLCCQIQHVRKAYPIWNRI